MAQRQIPGGAYISSPNANEAQVPGGVYYQVNAASSGTTTPAQSGSTSIRALVMVNNLITQITDALVGTGLKPLVLVNGVIQQRVASEGIPIVYDGNKMRTMSGTETLII